MSAENCFDNLILAETVGASDLKRFSVEYILLNPAPVLATRGMNVLRSQYPDLVFQLFVAATLGTDNDEIVNDADAAPPEQEVRQTSFHIEQFDID